ncbi:Histone deacetylase family protein [Dioscorea alata]|uniref:Histone deacetylase family protein n=1 Tax=Dioscorea alata TaxID=55571 RepID=A0ACB7VLX2_DIOAL|nr:Histone deacetylase family protein [Dioscorea alata]
MRMASDTLCASSPKAKELCGENRLHNRTNRVECQSSLSCFNESHGNLVPERTKGSSSLNQNFRERKVPGTKNDGTRNDPHIHTDAESENREHVCASSLGTTVAGDGDACLHCEDGRCSACLATRSQHCTRLRSGSTLQDLYKEEFYDDDDDSDWEPVHHFVMKKWFCTNCTMPNFDDVSHCDVCGEHKESEFFKHDVFKTHNELGTEKFSSLDSGGRDRESASDTSTAIGFDERMLLHYEVSMKSHPHPERPDRLRAIATCLADAGIFPGKCSLIPAREITEGELEMVHSVDHIETVQKSSCMVASYFTSDTYANEHSARAARLAAGLCADLAVSIMSGRSKNGFALVRPPGHHAGIKQAMGFCLHNNAAVAALAAQRAGAKKVLIVDWDVHHGNGTQEIFEGSKSVLYISLHRHEGGRFYPGTGAADEVGTLDGRGFSVNIPWSRGGVGDHDYIFAFQHIVLPIAFKFAPDMTIISAGFDAARGDPLGCCDVTPAGFAQMTNMLTSLSQGKLLVVLEGGYNLRSISSSATAVVKVLLGEKPSSEMSNVTPTKEGLQTILLVSRIQLEFWPILQETYAALRAQWDSVSSLDSNGRRKERG